MLSVDPNTPTARAALTETGEEKRVLDALAKIPQGTWLTSGDPEEKAREVCALPGRAVLVVYHIPMRDGDAHSKGGAKDSASYREFVAAVARGIRGHGPIVIVEPDGLAHTDFLTSGQRAARFALIAEAVATLSAAGAAVYIDAGDSDWVPVREMAKRLQQAGIAKAVGFATNVAHNEWLADEVLWAQRLRSILGPQVRYVLDTSRNGAGPNNLPGEAGWCNAVGTGLGPRPTETPGIEGCDGLLWVKPPAESDGACRGGPRAGAVWPEWAVALNELGRPKL